MSYREMRERVRTREKREQAEKEERARAVIQELFGLG
jgi:hypothetical protein